MVLRCVAVLACLLSHRCASEMRMCVCVRVLMFCHGVQCSHKVQCCLRCVAVLACLLSHRCANEMRMRVCVCANVLACNPCSRCRQRPAPPSPYARQACYKSWRCMVLRCVAVLACLLSHRCANEMRMRVCVCANVLAWCPMLAQGTMLLNPQTPSNAR